MNRHPSRCFRLWAVVVALFVSQFATAAELTKRQQDSITNQVIPAYQLSNPAMLIHTLPPLVAKMDDEAMTAANRMLAGFGIPSIEKMLTDARLIFVQQGMGDRLPPPNKRELALTLKTLKGRIQQVFHDQDRHPVMADEIPKPKRLKDYKSLFWGIHVLNNRLLNAAQLTQYAGTLAKKSSRVQAASHAEFAKLFGEINRRRMDLEERSIELRIRRLRLAATAFEPFDPKTNPVAWSAGDRFLAAHVIGIDQGSIESFFQGRKESNQTFVRESLDDPNLPKEIAAEAVQAKKKAGDLIAKTELLYEGMHWWLRGRYGDGPYARGLLKGHEALRNQQAMFSLYMPITTPKPTDPKQQSHARSPDIDRRHHYIWTTESRRISSSETTALTDMKFTSEVTDIGPPPPGTVRKTKFW